MTPAPVATCSVPERCGRLADDDGQGPMGLVAFDRHRDPQSIVPGTLREFFDFLLPAEELALAVFGVQKESLEVTEAVKDQARNLAGVRSALFSFRLRLRRCLQLWPLLLLRLRL